MMKTRKSLPVIAAFVSLTVAGIAYRSVAGPELPKEDVPAKVDPQVRSVLANGTWNLDPVHSLVGFSVRHMMVSDVHGSFDDFTGTIQVNSEDPSKSSVEFTAKAASINTRVKMRDDHLRSPDFFDVAKFPEISFKSTKVERIKKSDNFKVTGVFTMHGVSKTIEFPFTVYGPLVDGFGYTRGGIRAAFDINRQDYGVKWNQTLDQGGLALGNIVHVKLDLEAVKAGTGPKPKA